MRMGPGARLGAASLRPAPGGEWPGMKPPERRLGAAVGIHGIHMGMRRDTAPGSSVSPKLQTKLWEKAPALGTRSAGERAVPPHLGI